MPQHLPAVAGWRGIVFMRIEEGETANGAVSYCSGLLLKQLSFKEVWRNITLVGSCEEHLCRPLSQEYVVVQQSCVVPPSWSSLLGPWRPKQGIP